MVRMRRKPGAAPNAAPASSRPSGAQAAAGGLFDITDDLLRQRVEVLVGQRLFDRLGSAPRSPPTFGLAR